MVHLDSRLPLSWSEAHAEPEGRQNAVPLQKWFDLAREAPRAWVSLVREAATTYTHWSRDQIWLGKWRKNIYYVCPGEKSFFCMI